MSFKFPWRGNIPNNPGAIVSNPNNVLLFSPLKVKGLTLKNRISVSPMCQYSSEDGFLSDWHLVHLGNFAKGGAGLVHFEATAVAPNGRISPYDAGLWKDEQIPSYKRIVDFIHAHHTHAAFQIAHAGRKASTNPPFFPPTHTAVPLEEGGWTDVVGASPIAYNPEYLQPTELTEKGIKEIVAQFAATTKRALAAGFDWIEVHAAHGYLIHTFLSPLSNQRTDSYGGSFENRIRFCVEVVKAVRAEWPQDKPLAVRLSCSDWVEGGWDIAQTVQLVDVLKTLGVDLIDCSSAGLSPAQKITLGPLYQVHFAEEVKKKVEGVLIAAVGAITKPTEAEEILQKNQADVVMFAREFLREPFWPIKAAAKFGLEAKVTPQYERAYVNYVKHYNEDKN
eukprot:Phypoly_transcript_10136.p1 GENE.Phypoly_transcript_10136~~Phypoly_transcript_10136.p1  ORF type:complete len:428 (+),score=83.21 Phypoly_transcript_10136:107-1285(+)